MRKLALFILNSTTAVIRFCLDFKAKPNEKSHSCCLLQLTLFPGYELTFMSK